MTPISRQTSAGTNNELVPTVIAIEPGAPQDPVMEWLQQAAAEIPGTQAARRFRELVEMGKPDLALLLFQEAGDCRRASPEYWLNLQRAADLLKLWALKSAFSKKLKKCEADQAAAIGAG